MNDVIRNENGYDVSIIVPTISKRLPFFNSFVMPMLKANNPKEIIVVCDKGKAPVQRNIGLRIAQSKYVCFVDDDTILPKSFIKTLINSIGVFDVCYTGYIGWVGNKNVMPSHNFRIPTTHFNAERLKLSNFIDTTSLIRADVCQEWDEELKRFQDWDLYLTLSKKGCTFTACEDTYFMKFFMDEGITSKNNSYNEALKVIKLKHRI